MLASTRCRPQVASGSGVRANALVSGFTRSTFAPPAREQRPVTAFGKVAHGVFGCGRPESAAFASAPITLDANGFVAYTGESFAAPPPSAAGLVQSTSRPGRVVRPNRLFAGGVSLKVENATTQPSWRADRHARTCLK